MSFCTYCGSQLENNCNFCQSCGKSANNIQKNTKYTAEEEKCLDDFKGFLKWERFFYKLAGIIYLVCTIIFASFGLFFLLVTSVTYSEYNNYAMYVPSFLMCIIYLFIALIIYTPVVIINFSLKNRTEKYMNTVHTDIKAVEERCGNVAMIVVSVIFNSPAAIFVIINFVRTKTNKNLIDSISYKQKTEGSNA